MMIHKLPEILLFGLKPKGCSQYLPEYIKYDQLFTPEECASIIQFSDLRNDWEQATIFDGNDPKKTKKDTSYRTVKTSLVMPEQVPWFYERLLQRIKWTNDECFHFDLAGLNEEAQLLKYECATDTLPAGHYHWHQDYGAGDASLRKLSLVIQVSDPKDYDGCRLVLKTHREFEVPETKQGDTIIFPSFLPHMVTPITRGTRYSIALWVSGPPFR